MQVRERHKEQVQKKHPKKKQLRNATLKEANMRNGEKVQIRPGTNWTNMISEKSCKTLGKSKQNAKKKREKCNKSAKKMQIRPGTKLDKRGKNAKPIIGKMQEKYELRFYTCIFLAFVILHFLHCVFALAFVLYF